MPANRPGPACAAGQDSWPRHEIRHRGHDDQRETLEVADRAVPGHWDGDLIIGLDSSAIGTLVERTSRYAMLLHLPAMEGHDGPRAKNGPALAGHGAQAVRDAIASSFASLPGHLRRSLTWDQGAEMAQHAQLRVDTGLQVYFADPHSPWQRGTDENTNGLPWQYFPKGTDLGRHSRNDLDAVAAVRTASKRQLSMRRREQVRTQPYLGRPRGPQSMNYRSRVDAVLGPSRV